MASLFGKSDPAHEISASPADFIRSYVDLNGAVQKVVRGESTLILGPKGTGKSALGLYLERTSLGETYFAKMKNASHLPLAEILNSKRANHSAPYEPEMHGDLFFLANYLDVALSDTRAEIAQLREIKRVVKSLRDFGFMATDSGHVLLRAHGATYSLPTGQMGSLFRGEGGRELGIYSLLPYLERWALTLKIPRRHILILDGLDSIFLNDAAYDESLAGLAQAAYELNLALMKASATGSIVLLIRK